MNDSVQVRLRHVLGHDAVRRRFGNLLGNEKLHHAWLLYGSAGIGKRMLGYALATDYLCEKNHVGNAVHPACGECHACRMMAAGSHPDFMLLEREMNEKTNRLRRDVSIDQVRRMLTFLSLSGAESNRRVVLIGEAGRLNGQAANAMLKGLEEPAKGSLLLLVCEDAQALPATVRSRCMLQFLSPLNEDDMRTILDDMHIPADAVDFALRLAEGQPGKVEALADAHIASALLGWHSLLSKPERLDIGLTQQWIGKHVQQVPHDLIVDVVLNALKPLMLQSGNMLHLDEVFEAAHALAAWPQEVLRRTLRPGPTLLAHMLSIRLALRQLEQAA